MDTCTTGQGFGANAVTYYSGKGLKGHPGVDIACGYGSPIQAKANGLVFSTYPVEHPASDGYTAVFTLVQTPLELGEFSYGHVSEIDCAIGDIVQKGQVIAKEGNHGTVFSGGVQITPAMQRAGDHRGSHCHYQWRPVIRADHFDGLKKDLNTFIWNKDKGYGTEGLYQSPDGGYFQIYDYYNGYNGCIDWTQPCFTRNLFVGTSGYEVLLLQRALVLQGVATFEPTGYFGLQTFNAVRELQAKLNITPTGFVGPLTRSALNNTYPRFN